MNISSTGRLELPAIDGRTLVRVAASGVAGLAVWEFFARLAAPIWLGFALDPTALIEMSIGASGLAAELVHLVTGLLLFPLGYVFVLRPLARLVVPSWPAPLLGLGYGVALWVFAMYGMASVLGGMPPFMGFQPVAWASLVGHLGLGLGIAVADRVLTHGRAGSRHSRTLVMTLVLGAAMFSPMRGMALSDGLVTRPSAHSVRETLDRFAAAVRAADWVVFTEIDHAAAAKAVGMQLRSRAVVLFGNPRAGTAAMQVNPTLAIDLPMRVLVWEDDLGRVFLTRSTGDDIADRVFARHGVTVPPDGRRTMDGTLDGFARKATE